MTPALHALFDAQHAASRAQPEAALPLRRDRLLRMRGLLQQHGAALAQAVQADFGVRSAPLTEIADMLLLREGVADALRHLLAWSRPRRVRTPLTLQPARAWIQRQPLGVVGVLSPWNYPLLLSLGPAASALAAGNRVMLKPSERTPRTSALTAELVARHFEADEFCVINGDAALAAEFAGLPFDHLFFTGSTAVGRHVAAAAAANLTPTTLELGGKSPCVIDPSCRIDEAAARIAHGKLLNAGQTCIAPDYVLAPAAMHTALADALERAVQRMFPAVGGNPDYTALIDARHAERLERLVAEAVARGARVRVLGTDGIDARQMALRLVLGATPDMALMQEEIFGPVLPLLACEDAPQAVRFINDRPRPLALYWFGEDRAARDVLLQQTTSGGVTVNDTLVHIAHPRLPFGGVGDSGWGASHGEAGFLRFTHEKAVLAQSRWSLGGLLHPPYGPRTERLLAAMRRRG
ncbi:aldehyde dehydrogenase family protein [uncultured Pseudacidovorax sp.]|uniref:aldehyde dehydrogenase family protein n=1 Tax=uncultured Pseudacidovorax sp. TaxID=679313 RepID=UPI0025FCB398|nr:aldehyde dehydrogenase family protein [uncultured Pseudacidovorax sp.]